MTTGEMREGEQNKIHLKKFSAVYKRSVSTSRISTYLKETFKILSMTRKIQILLYTAWKDVRKLNVMTITNHIVLKYNESISRC